MSARAVNTGLRRWFIDVELFILAGLLVSVHVFSYTTFSPLDEFQHYDYVYKVIHGTLVRPGDRVDQAVMREEACRGIDYPIKFPPCDAKGPLDPNVFQESGFNTAEVHPPTYYFLTGLIARGFLFIPGIDSLMDAARITGVFWLGLALVLFWRILERFDVPVSGRVVVTVLLATTAPVLHASATVNPDSTALLAGALVILSTLSWERGRSGIAAPILAAALGVALKLTNLLAVVCCAIYLVIRRATQSREGSNRREPRPRYGLAIAALVGASILVALVWVVFHSLLAPAEYTNPQIDRFRVPSLTLDQVLSQSLALLTPLGRLGTPAPLDNQVVKVTAGLLNVLFLAALGGCLLKVSRIGRLETLAGAVTLVMLGGGTAVVIANYYLNSGIFVEIPGRYGLSLLPFLGVVLADGLKQTALLWATSVLAAVSLVTALFSLVTYG